MQEGEAFRGVKGLSGPPEPGQQGAESQTKAQVHGISHQGRVWHQAAVLRIPGLRLAKYKEENQMGPEGRQ